MLAVYSAQFFSHSHVSIPIPMHLVPIPIPFPSHGWPYSHSHGNPMGPMGSQSFPFPCTSLHCSRDDQQAAVRIERCIADVRQWMSANRLKLNTDKSSTELLWVRTRYSLFQHGHFPVLQLGPDSITPSDYTSVFLELRSRRLLTSIYVVSASCLAG